MKALAKPNGADSASSRPDENVPANLTRTEILDAAARLIVDRGYGACTMRAVAERVKIKAGSLYYHFSSKDEIVEEILNTGIIRLLEKVEQRLARLPPDASFAGRVEAAIDAHLSCMMDRETAYMQVYEHLPPVLKRRSRAMRDQYAKIWFGLFEYGIKTGEIDADADLPLLVPYFLGGINRVPEWLKKGKFKSADIARVTASMLLWGISSAAPPGAPRS